MDLPHHLRTLPPEALDALRFFAACEGGVATVDDICLALDLSDRGFGKLIRRLVTKGYVSMDSSQVYRLTMSGQEAAEELAAYDAVTPQAERADRAATAGDDIVFRRLVLAAPRALAAGQPAQVYLGFNRDLSFLTPVDLMARLSVVNGAPERPQEAQFHLADAPDHRAFVITPSAAPRLRLRVEVFQMGPDLDDFAACGGMYVDLDVRASAAADPTLVAYGVNLSIKRRD